MKTFFRWFFMLLLLLSLIIVSVQGAVNILFQIRSQKAWHHDIGGQFHADIQDRIDRAVRLGYFQGTDSLRFLIEQAAVDERIQSADMYDRDGKLLFSVGQQFRGREQMSTQLSGSSVFSVIPLITFWSPSQQKSSFQLEADGTVLGKITIHTLAPTRYAVTRDFVTRTFWAFTISLPISLLAAAVLAYITARRMAVEPIRLSRQLMLLAAGRRDVRFSVSNIRIREYARIASAAEQLQQKLQHSELGRTTFLNNLAHDLKTPVTALKILTDGFFEGIFPPSSTLEKNIANQLTALQQTIDGFLLYSRLEAHSLTLRRTTYPFDQTVKNVIGELSGAAGERSIIVRSSIEENVAITADRDLMNIAVEQMIRNMIQHAPSSTEAVITLKSVWTERHESTSGPAGQTGEACIRLICTNAGTLQLQNPEELFSPLVKGSSSRSTSGAGMGLSIARMIVRKHGGSLTFSNRQPDLITVEMLIPQRMEDSIASDFPDIPGPVS